MSEYVLQWINGKCDKWIGFRKLECDNWRYRYIRFKHRMLFALLVGIWRLPPWYAEAFKKERERENGGEKRKEKTRYEGLQRLFKVQLAKRWLDGSDFSFILAHRIFSTDKINAFALTNEKSFILTAYNLEPFDKKTTSYSIEKELNEREIMLYS